MNFKNKIVLITGAASGIGKETALYFAKLSATLSITDKEAKALAITATECKLLGTDVLEVVADLSEDKDIQKIVETTLRKFERIDVLVNCAGIVQSADVLHTNLMACYDSTMAVNLRAIVALTNAVAPELIKTKGSIVNISSITSISVVENNIIYNISKAALNHFTKCAALELASKGVRVNAILPGVVRTNLFTNSGYGEKENEEYLKKFAHIPPLKGLIEPEEIAGLIAFLASDKAKSITGSLNVIDKGLLFKGAMKL